MAIIRNSEPSFMTAKESIRETFGRAAASELSLRYGMENHFRGEIPDARIVHELVMGEGRVRADLVAIGSDTMHAVEVKGAYDNTIRLLHQVGMFQLCVPSVWMVVTEKHSQDAMLIRHLLPSVGLMVAHRPDGEDWHKYAYSDSDISEVAPATLEIIAKPEPREPVPEMTLRLMWRDELEQACHRVGVTATSKTTRPKMVKGLMETLNPEEIMQQACIALRGRNVMFRGDVQKGEA